MIRIKLKDTKIRVGSSDAYLYDPSINRLAKDWAVKTDGKVKEKGVEIDYSSKAYAIGGQGTETNNSKYYAEQAAISEANAMASEVSAEGSAETATIQAGIATSKAEEANTSAVNAGLSETNAFDYKELAKGYSESASDSAATATEKAAEADTSATNASGFASNAEQSADEAEEWAEKAKEWAETIDPSAYEKHIITTTGDSGLLTQEQIDIISDNQKNYLFINDGEVYQLVNTDSSITYKTFINFDIALSESITSKAIYIQLSPQAGNYGRWSKEDIDFEGYTAGSGLTLTGKQFSANVINSVTSSSTTDSLSANMGKELQDQITHLSSIGRFLALWDCETGLPLTEPEVMPYEYKTGDYYIVSNTGTTNYKPAGSSYTGVASTVVETGTVNEKNTYFYDGTSWSLIAGSGSIEVDNLTCEFTAQNKLQTIGVINQNDTTTALKIWSGDEADLPAVKDANTFYATEELGVSLLDVLYPVGSIYITTNAACPLSTLIAGSTWVLVGQDRVLQGAGERGTVGTTLNESLPNIKGVFTSGNNGWENGTGTGAFSSTSDIGYHFGGTSGGGKGIIFNANNSSSTYQDNAPVQPDAYLVNIFRRTN